MKNMLKNKGKSLKLTALAFTLIELLAVIVILAVIALIATPIILGIVEDAKKDAFHRSVELLVSTTDIDIANKTFEEEYTYEITDGNVNDLEISVKNTEGMKGKIIYNTDGKEVYAIHNEKYCIIKNEKMTKAEIREYKEGECNPTTLYSNGQRVYFDVDKGVGCTMEEYASSYDSTKNDFTNSLTGYNGLNGSEPQNSCLLFYAFNDDGGQQISLILDHNTTGKAYWTESGNYNNTKGPITILSELKNATASWNGTLTPKNYTVAQTASGNYTIPYATDSNGAYKARFITAGEIAQITGADVKEELLFNENTSVFNNWFYFDSLTTSSSDTCKSGNITGCEYGWLYDRTFTTCEDNGCYNNADASTYGYWTGTTLTNDSSAAWVVFYEGYLRDEFVSSGIRGVRPVIEVLKSKISPGVVPVIPQF